MRALLQRVMRASVSVSGDTVGAIGSGYLIFLGIEHPDTTEDTTWLVRKISRLKLFLNDEGKLAKNLIESGGQALVVSQFTLHASTKKGTRPSFHRAAPPEHAQALYQEFLTTLEHTLPDRVEAGQFGAAMEVSLINDGPVTILLDSQNPE